MKKRFFLFLAAMLVFVGCSDDNNETAMYWKIINVTVDYRDWKPYADTDGLNPYYMCEKAVPEIDRELYRNGNVFAYLVQNPGQSYEVQTPLNCSIPREDFVGNEWFTWTEHYSFDFMPGSVAFYVRYSDFADAQPPTQVFRIVLNY